MKKPCPDFMLCVFLSRGDLLFLTNYQNEDIRVGEIVVFKVRAFVPLEILNIDGTNFVYFPRVYVKVSIPPHFKLLSLLEPLV